MSDPQVLYIRHHATFSRVIKFAPLRGPLTEIGRDALPPDTVTDRGFFAETNDGLIAIYATPKGPTLAIGDRHLRLFKGECTGVVLTSSQSGRFTLERRGHDPIVISYPVPNTDSAPVFEPWESEDDLDFFRWLSARLQEPTFFEHYRLSQTTPIASEQLH